MRNSLNLLQKRIEHNRRKQEEDYQKEYNLRLARKGIGEPAAAKAKEKKENYSEK